MVDLSKLNPFKSKDKKDKPTEDLEPSKSKSSVKSLKDDVKKAIASANMEPARSPYQTGKTVTPNNQATGVGASLGAGNNTGIAPVRSGGLM